MSDNFFEGGQKAPEWQNEGNPEWLYLTYDAWSIEEVEGKYRVYSPDNGDGQDWLTEGEDLEMTMAFVEIFHTLVLSFENHDQ